MASQMVKISMTKNRKVREELMEAMMKDPEIREIAIDILGKHYKEELKGTLELYEAKTLTVREHLKNMETL